MNHLTTLYVNQIDREREVGDALRTRQILHSDDTSVDPVRPVPATATSRPATTSSRPTALRARATGR